MKYKTNTRVLGPGRISRFINMTDFPFAPHFARVEKKCRTLMDNSNFISMFLQNKWLGRYKYGKIKVGLQLLYCNLFE